MKRACPTQPRSAGSRGPRLLTVGSQPEERDIDITRAVAGIDPHKHSATVAVVESLNYQLRKIIKNRGHFPGDDAVVKLLWLAIRDIEDKRARDRTREKGTPRDQRKAAARLVEGATVQGWKQALGALALHYPDRLAPYIR